MTSFEERAIKYAELHSKSIDVKNPLGYGTDGHVFSTKHSAVKVFERERSYFRERNSYIRLAENNVKKIEIFAVPRLLSYDDDLLIVEMGFVDPAFFLVFGKAYVDEVPPYDPEQLQEWEDNTRELFGDKWPLVEKVLGELSIMGIRYMDMKYGNITFE